MSKLTHLDASGNARMVDVGDKQATLREARAEARVRMAAETLHLIETGGHKKGDVIAVARVATSKARTKPRTCCAVSAHRSTTPTSGAARTASPVKGVLIED